MTKVPKKILIIEDDIRLQKILAEKMKQEGYQVFKANDGLAGLALALKERPDLILLDIVMPKMDGLTMLRKLREDPWGKAVEVALLTNLSNAGDIASAFQQGVYDFLVKAEWKLEDIMKMVREKFNK